MEIKKLTILNGIIQDKFINGVPVVTSLIQPKGAPNARPMIAMTDVRGITVHDTGNISTGSTDEAHAKWIQNVENADLQYISAHVYLDENSITQTIPFNEISYHAGDGKGDGNRKTISIEMVEIGNRAKTEDNAKSLIGSLVFTRSSYAIFKHQDWSGKFCPRVLLSRNNGWGIFTTEIQTAIRDAIKPKEQPNPALSIIKVGSKVKMTGKKYATGQNIPIWARLRTYDVLQVKEDRMLVGVGKAVTGWIWKSECKLV